MIQDDISSAIQRIIMRERFYGSLFLGTNMNITKSVPTMAVGYNPTTTGIEMYINEDFWNKELTVPDKKRTERLRYGLFKHEILHVVFKHIFRYKDFSRKDVYGIAIDLVVNQFISNTADDKLYEELPENGCFLSTFPHFELEANQTTEYYYQRILEEEAKALEQKKQDGSGEEKEGEGSGECDGEGDKEGKGDGKGKSESSLNQSQKTLLGMLGEDKHKSWGELSKLSKDMRDFVEEQFDGKLEEYVKKAQTSPQWGTLPASIRDHLDAFIKSRIPTVNWRKILKKFTGMAENRVNKTSAKRESKAYGTNPGVVHKRKQEILVAVDTSGSVDNESLVLFFGELYHIWKAGASITVVECDTVISNEWTYKGVTPVTITGRGGTDFTAPIAYANKRKKFDAIVYFTDGFGPKPAVTTRTRVMWFICPTGCELNTLNDFPGWKVKMPTV